MFSDSGSQLASQCVMKFRFASIFICFKFAGDYFSSHSLLSLDFFLGATFSAFILCGLQMLFLQNDRFALTSVKMIEWHHKQWILIFEAITDVFFDSENFLITSPLFLQSKIHQHFYCFRVIFHDFCFIFELHRLLQDFYKEI